MARIVLDSSVVIGLVNSSDAHHQRAVAAVAAARTRGDAFILPASVLSECMVRPFKEGHESVQKLRHALVVLFGPVRSLDEDVALASAEIRRRDPGIRPEDSWVIATGIVDDALILTCDRRWRGVDPRIHVLDD